MELVNVKFTETYTVKSVGGPTYLKGSVHPMTEASARHFVRKGVASPTFDRVAIPLMASQSSEERKITTNVDLHGAFDAMREKEGIANTPPEVQTNSGGDSQSMETPLVSCIMPTFNRREFIAAAIDCWIKQTYQNKELIILDDGDQSAKDLVPKIKGIRYIKLKERKSTGSKRNQCCELAKGSIICHFDDDDWSTPGRIQNQVEHLRLSGKPVTGYADMLYWHAAGGYAMKYQSTIGGYVCGMSLCYLRDWWKDHKFTDKKQGSDNDIIYPNLKSIAAFQDMGIIVARAHSTNVGGNKDSIGKRIDKESLPVEFWENQKLIKGNHVQA